MISCISFKSLKSNTLLFSFLLLLIFPIFTAQSQPEEFEWKIAPLVAVNSSSQHHNIMSYGVKIDYFESEYFSASARIEGGDGYFRCSANILTILYSQADYMFYYDFQELSYFSGMAGHIPLNDETILSPELSLLDFVFIDERNWLIDEPIDPYYGTPTEIFGGSSIGLNLSHSLTDQFDFNIFMDALYIWGKRHTTLNSGFRLGFKFD